MTPDVLVVVDMQNDFIDGVLGTPEAVRITPEVVKLVHQFKGRVVFTQDTHFEDYLTTQEGHLLPVVHCIDHTQGWELQRELKAYQAVHHSPIFIKHTFGSTELAKTLVKWHTETPIDSITFVGLCTDICVISNATLVKAHLPEVPLHVIASACAGVTPQSHDNALSALKMIQVHID